MSSENNIGSKIEEFILTNIKIWHEATKIKDVDGNLRKDTDLSVKERVQCALDIRKLNTLRSKIRWEIDKNFDCGADETKVFSKGE